MKRKFLIFIFSIFVFSCTKIFPEQTLIFEAENFKNTFKVKILNFGGINGVLFEEKGSFIETDFEIKEKKKMEVWIYVYFPWLGKDTIKVNVSNREYLGTAKTDLSGRWDMGNFQVWHWVKVGDVFLEKGIHKIYVESLSSLVRLDKLVLYDGKDAWKEEWMSGSLSLLYLHRTKNIWQKGNSFVLEVENFEKIDGIVKKEGEDLVVELINDSDLLAGIISTQEVNNIQVWARIYFQAKNIFEGYTLEEMANQLYFSIDGALQKTIFAQNEKMWFWVFLGEYNFRLGKHLITFQKVGETVKIDKIVFYKGKDAFTTQWFNKKYVHNLPFGIPNDISFSNCKRVSDYRVFGNLSLEAKLTWLGKEKDGILFPLEIQLPQKPGFLVLEKVKGIKSSEALSNKNRETQISLWISGNAPNTRIGIIYFDRTGEAFFTYLTSEVNWNEPKLISHTFPISTFGKRHIFFDKTGEKPEKFLSPEIKGDDFVEYLFSEGGNNDGILDYPLEIKYIVIHKIGNEKAKIILGEPFFEDPFEIKGKIYKEEEVNVGKKITVEIIVTNKSPYEKNAIIYYTWRPYPYKFLDKINDLKTWEKKILSIPPQSSVSYLYTKVLEKQTVHKFFYTIGQKEPKYLFFPTIERIEENFGCFYFQPIKKKDGSIIKREEVYSLYGKNFVILDDGIDVTSIEYAEKLNLEERLVPVGYDLSDENGWPYIEIPPGVVAIDPEKGRVKFFTGNKEKLAILSKLDTGFGVPGSGTIKVRDNFAFIAPGEGDYTVVSVLDKNNPEVISFIPSWYFSYDLLFFKNYAYFESSKRGLILIDDISNPYKPGYLRGVNFDRLKYGKMIAIFEDQEIGISENKDNIYIHSLADPLYPKMIGVIKGAKGFILTPDKRYAFTYLKEKIGLFDMKIPAKPVLVGYFLEKNDVIVAVSEDKIALKKEKEVNIFQFRDTKNRIEFKKIGSLKIPPNCGRLIYAFNKDLFYLIDGKGGPGQYSIGYGNPPSRWFIYEIKENAEPIFIYEDKSPTAYSSVYIEGNYGYIVDYNYGLWIFDLKDPAKPNKISGIATAGEADALWIADRNLYMWQTFGGTIFIIDISNPEKPKKIGEYWDGMWISYENKFRGNYTIGGKNNFIYIPKLKKGIIIVDISNPKNPKMVGVLQNEKGEPVMGSGSCIYIRDNTLFIIDRKTNLIIYDISTPNQPKILSSLSLSEKINTLYSKGDFVYLCGNNMLFIVEIKNKSNPKIISQCDLKTIMNSDECLGGIAVGKNYAYLTIRENKIPSRKLCIIDISSPENPKLVKIFTPLFDLLPAPCNSGWADFYQDLIISGEYLYIGNYGQIECYDISDPENPKLFDRKHIGFQWSVGRKKGKYLFVPTLRGLVVLSTPNSSQVPKNPQLKILHNDE